MGTGEGSQREESRALVRAGERALRAGKLHEALLAAEKASVLEPSPEALALEGLARSLLGDAAGGRAVLDAAEAAAAGDGEREARVLIVRGDAAFASGDTESARDAWDRARIHFESYWDGAALARILAGLAMVGAGVPLELAHRAVEEAEAAGDALGLARGFLSQALLEEDAAQAAAYAGRAAALCDGAGLVRELAEVCLRWGGHAADDAEALSWLQRAESLFHDLGTARDVERARVLRRRREGTSVPSLAEALAALESSDMLPLGIARTAARLLGAERAVVALVRNDELDLAGAVRMPEGETGWRAPARAVTRLGGGPTLFPELGALACPLSHDGQHLGALYCDRERPFDDGELELASVFAGVAAVRLAARSLAQRLRRSQRRRDALLAATAEGIVVVGSDGKLEALNAIAQRLLGPAAQVPAPLATWPSLEGAGEVGPQGVVLPGGAAIVNALPVAGVGNETGGVVLALRPLGTVAPSRLRLGDVVAVGPLMRRRLRVAEAAAQARSPVLLHGEPGSGRRFLARCIAGEASEAPAILVDCRAVPDGQGLVGSPVQPGLITSEASVPIVLAEIDALADGPRAALLDLLAAPGAPRVFVTSGKPIADLARPLARDARERLVALTLDVPPLRERTEDIPFLVERLLDSLAAETGRSEASASSEVIAALAGFGWPGNVAELERVLAAELGQLEGDSIYQVPAALFSQTASTGKSIADAERQLLIAALKQHRGNVPRVARTLGVSKGTVYNMMRKYRVDPTGFRASS